MHGRGVQVWTRTRLISQPHPLRCAAGEWMKKMGALICYEKKDELTAFLSSRPFFIPSSVLLSPWRRMAGRLSVRWPLWCKPGPGLGGSVNLNQIWTAFTAAGTMMDRCFCLWTWREELSRWEELTRGTPPPPHFGVNAPFDFISYFLFPIIPRWREASFYLSLFISVLGCNGDSSPAEGFFYVFFCSSDQVFRNSNTLLYLLYLAVPHLAIWGRSITKTLMLAWLAWEASSSLLAWVNHIKEHWKIQVHSWLLCLSFVWQLANGYPLSF